MKKYKIRFIALWRVLTTKNFILVECKRGVKNGEKTITVRPLYRTDFTDDGDSLALKAAYFMSIDDKNTLNYCKGDK
jgi:hypothetical protein